MCAVSGDGISLWSGFCLVRGAVAGYTSPKYKMGRIKQMAAVHNIEAARETYQGFIRLIKIATPAIAVLVAVVVYLLAH